MPKTTNLRVVGEIPSGIKFTEAEVEELASFLGEGIHTGFRKAGDSQHAIDAHRAIDAMDEKEWRGILNFVADPLADFITELLSSRKTKP